ncbi:MAG TPA: G/U mismatch-specific DNA glycosylase [Mycobacteriales bacterium]|nr:G/U mismatch-specific DNA glycosylase [Mycobacteriales bacterium]
MLNYPRPAPAELAAAFGRPVADLVAPELPLLLCGINPSLWSAVAGAHFGNPANRLWPTLHLSGLTPRRLHPSEAAELLAAGIGVTNVVNYATATAAEISSDQLRAGRARVEQTVSRWSPSVIAFLGLSAYRIAFGRPKAAVGRQEERIGDTVVWLLPNPSGLNAHYQLPDLVRVYGDLRAHLAANH